jgi:2-methylfumaryl-CoA isomerase
MYELLRQMRVIEGSSFVASPLCGLYLAQMGAEVIRFDSIGGGPDYHRWPVAPSRGSFYWEGLNKGKKSIALNLSKPAGREIAAQLATAPGKQGGLFVTNYPAHGFLAHEKLIALRPDLITVRIMGFANGSTGLDYTVNSSVGLPFMTGSPANAEPVNHVLPAWDLLTGAYAAFALLAADRLRAETGLGREIRVPLSDIAVTTLGNLGQVAEVLAAGADRPRLGNQVFGAFGRDFLTQDGKRLMIVALTPRQWAALLDVLVLHAAVEAVETRLGISFAKDESLRFEHREELTDLIGKAVAVRQCDELRAEFDAHDVCYGPYQGLYEAASEKCGLIQGNPVFTAINNPSGYTYPAPGSPATLPGQTRHAPIRAPRLGEHTDQILVEVLGLSAGAIGRLHDEGTVASG